MPKASHPVSDSILQQLAALGERLRAARRLRHLSQEEFGDQIGVSRETQRRLENGDPSISMGTYMNALQVLGLNGGMDKVALEDDQGRKLHQ